MYASTEQQRQPADRAGVISHVAPTRIGNPHRGRLAAWQASRATKLLLAGIDRRIPLVEIAAACRLSLSHFIRSFRRSMGDPPHRWIIGRRIAMSQDLLRIETGRTLAEIALTCGFSDQSHFTRTFARVTGWTPNAWRRAHAKAPEDATE